MAKSNKVGTSCYALRLRDHKKNPIIAEQAFEIYKLFMRTNNRKGVGTIEKFIELVQYVHYHKFALFVKHVHIDDISMYLRAMRTNKRSPNLWSNNWSYCLYFEFLDKKKTPIDAIEDTISTLFDIAELADLSVAQLLIDISVPEVLLLMRQRRLSPWIMLHSTTFKNKLEKVDEVLQLEFIDMFDMDSWQVKFAKNPSAVALAKNLCGELGI